MAKSYVAVWAAIVWNKSLRLLLAIIFFSVPMVAVGQTKDVWANITLRDGTVLQCKCSATIVPLEQLNVLKGLLKEDLKGLVPTDENAYDPSIHIQRNAFFVEYTLPNQGGWFYTDLADVHEIHDEESDYSNDMLVAKFTKPSSGGFTPVNNPPAPPKPSPPAGGFIPANTTAAPHKPNLSAGCGLGRESTGPQQFYPSDWPKWAANQPPPPPETGCTPADLQAYRAYQDALAEEKARELAKAKSDPKYWMGHWVHDGRSAVGGTKVVIEMYADGTFTRTESFSSSVFTSGPTGPTLGAGQEITKSSIQGTWVLNGSSMVLSSGDYLDGFTRN